MANFDLEEFLPFRLNRVSEWIGTSFAKLYKEEFELSRSEWRTLANIGQHGHLTAKEICRHGHMHKTEVSRAVSALEKRGWILRETNKSDRRLEWLFLTPQGTQAFKQLSRLGLEFVNQLNTMLTDKQASALDQGLQALERLIESETGNSSNRD